MQALDGAKVVVIGGGAVAERKVHSLIECAATVTLIAPTLTPGLSRLAAGGHLTHEARRYCPGDLTGVALAFVAIDDGEASARVAREAGTLNVPVNVVDRPDLCTFIVPAVMRRGRLTIAVSTGGASPAWAGLIKRRLLGEFGEEYTRLMEALAAVRRRCHLAIADPVRRREVLERLADDSLVELARAHSVEALEADLWARVEQWSTGAGTDSAG
jgi:precorrin-2 dehydrogenase/sirohydrochlorin ferrochelatase